MDISYIDEFIVLAEVKKFSAAAQRLHISQSTLSRHIQAMENELGCPLFTRTTREMELSPFGKIYLPHARKIAEENQEAEKALKAFAKQQNAKIRIGVVRNPDLYQVPECLIDFQRTHPDIPFHIIEGSLSELHGEFLAGNLNITAMAYARWETFPARFVPVGESRLAAVLPSGHPLAAYEKIPLPLLENVKLAVPEKSNFVYHYLEEMFRFEAIVPDVFYQGNTSGISALLEENMAVLIQDCRHARLQLKGTLVLRELLPDISYTYGVEYHSRLTRSEESFVRFVRQKFSLPGAAGDAFPAGSVLEKTEESR